MKKSFGQNITDKLRSIIPLSLRIKVGPAAAYVAYFFHEHFQKNRPMPHVLSIADTIDLVQKEKLSVIRFGDGEMTLINNNDLAFQTKNADLIRRLKIVLQTNKKGLLICIPGIWGKLDVFTGKYFRFALHHLFRYRHIWNELLSPDQIYGDAFIARPYLIFKDKSGAKIIFGKIMSLWEGKDIVLIEGEKSRLGVGNDLFDDVKSLERILCPAENAFSKYDRIKEEALKISKNKLILLSLGPTAKVLAYDLFLSGYRVIDIGHIDMEYEMFLRNKTELTKVPYKYFNEISERNPEDCTDKKYLEQIIARIK